MKKDLPKKSIPPAKKDKKDAASAAEGAAAAEKGALKKPVKAAAAKTASKPAAKTSAKKAKAPPAPRPARAPRGGIPFICSECYEEFVLPASSERESVACPECMHVGKRPDEDFLRQVALHKSGERSAFVSAVFSGMLLILVALLLAWASSPYSPFKGSDNLSKVLMVLAVGVVGSAGFLMWSVSRYEKNRWEIYF